MEKTNPNIVRQTCSYVLVNLTGGRFTVHTRAHTHTRAHKGLPRPRSEQRHVAKGPWVGPGAPSPSLLSARSIIDFWLLIQHQKPLTLMFCSAVKTQDPGFHLEKRRRCGQTPTALTWGSSRVHFH